MLSIRENIVKHIEEEQLCQGHASREEFRYAWGPTIQAVKNYRDQQSRVDMAKKNREEVWEQQIFGRAFANKNWAYNQWDGIQQSLQHPLRLCPRQRGSRPGRFSCRPEPCLALRYAQRHYDSTVPAARVGEVKKATLVAVRVRVDGAGRE